ncbi:hypothetical protein J6590_084006 [Homalodisca vitripennis]|nr:hypothetical protein J6590_084006 [Homalodisca vitripennis]
MGTVEVEVNELISSTQEITRSGVRWNPKVDLSQEVKDNVGHITTRRIFVVLTGQSPYRNF